MSFIAYQVYETKTKNTITKKFYFKSCFPFLFLVTFLIFEPETVYAMLKEFLNHVDNDLSDGIHYIYI